MATITNLLVATDLTYRSECALARALEIQQSIGEGLLTVLHVLPSGLPGRIERNQKVDAESFLAERLSKIPSAHGSSVEAVVRIGDAFSVIINESVARRAELLVLGEPSRHQRTHQFAGTTAECVMRFSSCPVLLVRRKAKGRYGRVVVAFDGSDGAVRALRAAFTIAPGAEYLIVHAWWPQRQILEGRARKAVDAERNRMRGLIQREVKQVFRGIGLYRSRDRTDRRQSLPGHQQRPLRCRFVGHGDPQQGEVGFDRHDRQLGITHADGIEVRYAACAPLKDQ